MLIIGLTGPTGAGKGYISQHFLAHGIPSIDTDAVYHSLLIPPSACLDELTARFGSAILNADGTLDRPALAAIVFAPGAEDALDDLDHITHRHVLAEVRRLCAPLSAAGTPAVLVDAPRLYESGFDQECDKVIAVLADRETRLARIMARDDLDTARATARLDAQKPDSFFTDRADAVIWNDIHENHHKSIHAITTQNHKFTTDHVAPIGTTTADSGIFFTSGDHIAAIASCEADLTETVRRLLTDWGICHEV